MPSQFRSNSQIPRLRKTPGKSFRLEDILWNRRSCYNSSQLDPHFNHWLIIHARLAHSSPFSFCLDTRKKSDARYRTGWVPYSNKILNQKCLSLRYSLFRCMKPIQYKDFILTIPVELFVFFLQSHNSYQRLSTMFHGLHQYCKV